MFNPLIFEALSVLKLNLKGSVKPFSVYLTNFLKVNPSILLEIDTVQRMFVAKSVTGDRGAIRFSAISFDDANISVISDTLDTRGDARIKVGILIQLSKLIKIVERFGQETDKEGNPDFIIKVTYDKLDTPDGKFDYVATSIGFESTQLKMRMDGFKISELRYMSDDEFSKNMFNVSDPVKMKITAADISSIAKTSDIIKIDAKNDALVFYAEGNELFIKERTRPNSEPCFVFKLGEFEAEPSFKIDAAISRIKFIDLLDHTDEDFEIILGQRSRAIGNNPSMMMVDRILFDSINSNTKVVISIMAPTNV